MLTLTAASKETKLILKWAAIILAALFILILAFRALVLLKDTFFPTPPPKPTVIFGKISPPQFPANAVNNEFTYSIDTVSGQLPEFGDQTKIYKIYKPKSDLLALKNLGEKARQVGFKNGPFKISDDFYYWTDSGGSFLKTLRFNIHTADFTLFSPFYFDADILSAKNLPKEDDAIKEARKFLENLRYATDDFDFSKTTTQLLSVRDGQLINASSLGTAHAYRVNFYQNHVNNLPIIYEKPNESNINFIVTGSSFRSQIVRGDYMLQRPTSESSTYPIKTTEQAFEELKEGKAYIASSYAEEGNIKIKDVFLAYYISSKEQDFLYPVIVFEGNDGFFAYVSAVTDEWVEK
jgi:hypothetical protein